MEHTVIYTVSGVIVSVFGYIGISCINYLKKIFLSIEIFNTHIAVQEIINENTQREIQELKNAAA